MQAEHRVLANKGHRCWSCRGAEGEGWDLQGSELCGQHRQGMHLGDVPALCRSAGQAGKPPGTSLGWGKLSQMVMLHLLEDPWTAISFQE